MIERYVFPGVLMKLYNFTIQISVEISKFVVASNLVVDVVPSWIGIGLNDNKFKLLISIVFVDPGFISYFCSIKAEKW